MISLLVGEIGSSADSASYFAVTVPVIELWIAQWNA